MTETHATPPARPVFPAGRYGHRRAAGHRPRWVPVLLGVLAAVAGLLVAVRLFDQYGQPSYEPQVINSTDRTAARVIVEFEVRKPAGEPARCTVRARAYNGTEVGRAVVAVPAGDARSTVARVRYTLPTTAQAFAVDVPGCGPAGDR